MEYASQLCACSSCGRGRRGCLLERPVHHLPVTTVAPYPYPLLSGCLCVDGLLPAVVLPCVCHFICVLSGDQARQGQGPGPPQQCEDFHQGVLHTCVPAAQPLHTHPSSCRNRRAGQQARWTAAVPLQLLENTCRTQGAGLAQFTSTLFGGMGARRLFACGEPAWGNHMQPAAPGGAVCCLHPAVGLGSPTGLYCGAELGDADDVNGTGRVRFLLDARKILAQEETGQP